MTFGSNLEGSCEPYSVSKVDSPTLIAKKSSVFVQTGLAVVFLLKLWFWGRQVRACSSRLSLKISEQNLVNLMFKVFFLTHSFLSLLMTAECLGAEALLMSQICSSLDASESVTKRLISLAVVSHESDSHLLFIGPTVADPHFFKLIIQAKAKYYPDFFTVTTLWLVNVDVALCPTKAYVVCCRGKIDSSAKCPLNYSSDLSSFL